MFFLAVTAAIFIAGCSDYADEYEKDYKEQYGSAEEISKVGEIPQYKWSCPTDVMECTKLWEAYDGVNFGLKSVMGTSWNLIVDSKSTVKLNAADSNNVIYYVDNMPRDITPLLRHGGISGQVQLSKDVRNPFVTFYMGLKDLNLESASYYSGITVALASTSDFYVSLLEIKDGKIISEYRNSKSAMGSNVKKVGTAHAWFQDFIHISGESNLTKFLAKVNAVGITFTETHTESTEGFFIHGLAVFAEQPEDDGEGSSSSEVAESSNAKAESSNTADVDSVNSSSSTSKFAFDIPTYKVSRKKYDMFWYGYDGENFETQTRAKTSISIQEQCNFIVFNTRDSVGVDSHSSDKIFEPHPMPDMMNLLLRSGGIAGTVRSTPTCSNGATTDKVRLIFPLGNTDLSDTNRYNALVFGLQHEGSIMFTTSLATVSDNNEITDEHKSYWSLYAPKDGKSFTEAGFMFGDFVKNYDAATLQKINAFIFEFDYSTTDMSESKDFNIVFVGFTHAKGSFADENVVTPQIEQPFPTCGNFEECAELRKITGCTCEYDSESKDFTVAGCVASTDVIYNWQWVTPYIDAFGNALNSAHITSDIMLSNKTAQVTVKNRYRDSTIVTCPQPQRTTSSSSFADEASSSSFADEISSSSADEASSSSVIVSGCTGTTLFEVINGEPKSYFGNIRLEASGIIIDTSFESDHMTIATSKDNKSQEAYPYAVVMWNPDESFHDLTEWGGLCITYSSDVIFNARAYNNALGSIFVEKTFTKQTEYTTVSRAWNEFQKPSYSISSSLSRDDIIKQAYSISIDFTSQSLGASPGITNIAKITTINPVSPLIKDSEKLFYWSGKDNQYTYVGGDGIYSPYWNVYSSLNSDQKGLSTLPDNKAEFNKMIETNKSIYEEYSIAGSSQEDNFFLFSLYLTNKNTSLDVSEWKGLCITYKSTEELNLVLHSNNDEMYNYILPEYKLEQSTDVAKTVNIPWGSFISSDEKTFGTASANQFIGFSLNILYKTKTNSFNIYEIGSLETCSGYSGN